MFSWWTCWLGAGRLTLTDKIPSQATSGVGYGQDSQPQGDTEYNNDFFNISFCFNSQELLLKDKYLAFQQFQQYHRN